MASKNQWPLGRWNWRLGKYRGQQIRSWLRDFQVHNHLALFADIDKRLFCERLNLEIHHVAHLELRHSQEQALPRFHVMTLIILHRQRCKKMV